MPDETCLDGTMQDLIPLLAHDALGPTEADALRVHLATCASCRAELDLVRVAGAAITAVAPRVSVEDIVMGVQRATRLRLETPAAAPRTKPARRAPMWLPRRYAAAAASLILAASASFAVLTRFGGLGPAVDRVSGSTIDSASIPGPIASAAAGISVTGGLADLSDEELAVLLDELDRVEATVAAEPATLRRALVDTPEEF